MKKKLYILIGPPGSGKGTQAERLTKELKINFYSVGEILRGEVTNKTVLGKKALPFMKSGALVPNKLIVEMMLQKLARSRKSLIFDGFPRSLAQAEALDKFVQERKIQKIVIEISLPGSKILERIAGRRYCDCGGNYHIKFNPPKVGGKCDDCGEKLKIRPDAKPATVKKRINIYNAETKPIISFYKKNKNYLYRRVSGNQSIEHVYKDLLKEVKKIK